MGFEEARRQMNREIQTLKSLLDRDGEVTLGKIGLLQKDAEGKISFRPMQTAEEAMADMGMERIRLRDLGAADSVAAIRPSSSDIDQNATTGVKPFPAEYSQADESEASNTVKAETTDSEGEHKGKQWIRRRRGYYYISIRKAVGNIAAAVILSLGITAAVMLPKAEPRQETVEASVVPVKELLDTGNRKTPIQSSAKQIAGESYRLVVGSFKTEEEAQGFIRQHCESAYGLEITPTGKMWLVTAASSSERESLLSLSRDENFRQEFSQCWVWRERK